MRLSNTKDVSNLTEEKQCFWKDDNLLHNLGDKICVYFNLTVQNDWDHSI